MITLKNTGTETLKSVAITVTGTNATAFAETNTCGTSVAGGASCTITVTFTPSVTGTLTASVNIADNAANTPQTVALTGSVIPPSFSLTASAVSAAPGAGGTSTITATGTGGYTGTITLNSCVLATSPSGAVDIPTCVVGASPITIAAGSASGMGTVTFTTTAPGAAFKIASLQKPRSSRTWAGAGGIAIAGLFVLFGIPARNRKWRSMLGVFLCMAALGVLSGCGGGSSGPPPNPGTTAGAYTYTVTGTDGSGNKQTVTVNLNIS
jgi:hypothetical protein